MLLGAEQALLAIAGGIDRLLEALEEFLNSGEKFLFVVDKEQAEGLHGIESFTRWVDGSDRSN